MNYGVNKKVFANTNLNDNNQKFAIMDLTDEEEMKIACLMVLCDLLKQAKEDGHETAELKSSREEMEVAIQKLLDTCTEEEKKKVIASYLRERKNTPSLNKK